jgi:hypothetical protein
VGPDERRSPEGKDMAGGGRGGPVVFPHPNDDASWAPTNGVTTTLPEGKDIVVFPHPNDDNAGRLLDKVGSTNANDDDNDDTPRPPPKTTATPRGGRGAGTTPVPDDDVTAAAGRRR